jgi:hypothetical protein
MSIGPANLSSNGFPIADISRLSFKELRAAATKNLSSDERASLLLGEGEGLEAYKGEVGQNDFASEVPEWMGESTSLSPKCCPSSSAKLSPSPGTKPHRPAG